MKLHQMGPGIVQMCSIDIRQHIVIPCDNIGYTQLRCPLVAHTAILARQEVTGVTGGRGIIRLKQSEACFR